jgi:hypothetical protein
MAAGLLLKLLLAANAWGQMQQLELRSNPCACVTNNKIEKKCAPAGETLEQMQTEFKRRESACPVRGGCVPGHKVIYQYCQGVPPARPPAAARPATSTSQASGAAYPVAPVKKKPPVKK